MLLATLTGTLLYFKMPWPMTGALVPPTWNEYSLRLVALRDPWTYAGLKASYHVMVFTTHYMVSIFTLEGSGMQINDVIGPMVNKTVKVIVVRGKGSLRLRDIELDE
jgi:hypothetical protein